MRDNFDTTYFDPAVQAFTELVDHGLCQWFDHQLADAWQWNQIGLDFGVRKILIAYCDERSAIADALHHVGRAGVGIDAILRHLAARAGAGLEHRQRIEQALCR
ncbi:MAG: hypothetical protein GY802_20435 [Gammaproteobacteria bacterium]|nr:hypothetical protein [Gammaproteobacteria bacterium]